MNKMDKIKKTDLITFMFQTFDKKTNIRILRGGYIKENLASKKWRDRSFKK